MSKKVCHCAHCLYEAECADNDWSLAGEYDPCCPNMIALRKQLRAFDKQRIIDLSLGSISYEKIF